MQIINSENTTCMETSQENVFRSCCQIKNGSSSNLVLLIISFIFFFNALNAFTGKEKWASSCDSSIPVSATFTVLQEDGSSVTALVQDSTLY